MKQVKLKQVKDLNTAPMKELEEQQLFAEIKIAEAQFDSGLATDNATARSVVLERLAKRA